MKGFLKKHARIIEAIYVLNALLCLISFIVFSVSLFFFKYEFVKQLCFWSMIISFFSGILFWILVEVLSKIRPLREDSFISPVYFNTDDDCSSEAD